MKKNTNKNAYQWNLSLLYSSPTDPQIEKDVVAFETLIDSFAKRYEVKEGNLEKSFLTDNSILLEALKEYEKISEYSALKILLYFNYSIDIDAKNTEASAKLALFDNRLTIAFNKITFFEVSLGKIEANLQKEILSKNDFKRYKVLLQRIFDDARYTLSTPEENIMSLKSLPAYDMWVSANERILNVKSVQWKGKEIPLPTAMQSIHNLPRAEERRKLTEAVAKTLKSVAPFAEAEINAVITNKKINDQIRGYKTPYENTVLGYRNNPQVVDQLRKVVTEHVWIPHEFYKVKSKLLGLKKLSYSDRAAKIGVVKSKYTFDDSATRLKEVFGSLNPKFREILDVYIKNGQIDVFPRVGKQSGAYCSSSYNNPTFVLLNHIDDLHSFTTCAHELGHAFHSEFSRIQGAFYSHYSTSLAETASTLFEAIALRSVYDSLSNKEKIIVLHDRINDDIQTVFRQIACFNFELDLHTTIRAKGYIAKEEIADIHNKNMKEYLGPIFDLKQDDGYFFVTWSHIRRFFYVYTYAYGQLVSKALLRRYHKDQTFWKKIEQFLSAGGKDSPENILKEIGIDVSSPEFFKEGLMEIADDIKELERLTGKQSTKKKSKK